MNKSEIVYLTVLRGIASIWVGLHHAVMGLHHFNLYSMKTLSVVAYKGWLGVDLFFILSGFILAYSYQYRMNSFSWSLTLDFLMARIARVLPAHFFVMLIMAFAVSSALFLGLSNDSAGVYTTKNFLNQFFLLTGTGLFSPDGWNTPTWSIGSEMIAYFSFPFLILYFRKVRSISKVALSMAVLFALLLTSSWLINDGKKFMFDFHLSSLRVLSEFFLGMLLFQLSLKLKKPKKIAVPLIFLGLAGILIHPFYLQHAFFDFCYLIYFLILILGCAQLAGRTRLPIFSYLGEISYGFYLIHSLVIIILNQVLKKIQWPEYLSFFSLVLFLSVSLAFSALIYESIEKPARSYVLKKWKELKKAIEVWFKKPSHAENEPSLFS